MLEDGYSSAHTAGLINTSQQIMSGNLQRRLLSINTHASSIVIKPGVQHEGHLTMVKNTPSTIIGMTNNICCLYVFVPQVNKVTSIQIP